MFLFKQAQNPPPAILYYFLYIFSLDYRQLTSQTSSSGPCLTCMLGEHAYPPCLSQHHQTGRVFLSAGDRSHWPVLDSLWNWKKQYLKNCLLSFILLMQGTRMNCQWNLGLVGIAGNYQRQCEQGGCNPVVFKSGEIMNASRTHPFQQSAAWIIKFIINKTIHLCPILHLMHLKWEIRSVFNSGTAGKYEHSKFTEIGES